MHISCALSLRISLHSSTLHVASLFLLLLKQTVLAILINKEQYPDSGLDETSMALRPQHQRGRQPFPNQTTIEALESSIEHLVTGWQRKQRCCHCLFLPFSCFLDPQKNDSSDQNANTERASWRTRLADFMDSLPVHLAAIILILLDLTLTVLDISTSLLACNDSRRKLAEQSRLYHWAGVAILGLLSAKVLALAMALGSGFFMRPGHVVDAIVMIGALVLEVVADGKGAGLLVVVSLWRIVRVLEGAFELSNEAIEAQIEGVIMEFELLRAENQQLEGAVAEEGERIKQLEAQIARIRTGVMMELNKPLSP